MFSWSVLIGIIVLTLLWNLLSRIKEKMKSFDATGRAVLITGCDSGFGFDIAVRAKAKGFQVFAGCLNAPSYEPAVENENNAEEDAEPNQNGDPPADADPSPRLAPLNGAAELERAGCHVMVMDVTRDVDVNNAVKFVQDKLEDNNLWAVVNNAGVAAHAELEWCTPAMLSHFLEVNTVGVYRVTRAFLPLLRETFYGARIVNVASVASYFTMPGFTFYAAAKHANRSLSDGMRREWAKFNMMVSSIEPTLYRTNISHAEYLVAELGRIWRNLSPDLKAVYGSRYYRDYKEIIVNHSRTGRTDTTEVIDDMMDALTSPTPSCHYHPGLIPKIRFHIFRLLPEFVIDALFTSPKFVPPYD